ncbi:hypothetical protein FACS189485_05280 [Spirochaetia bacterium]|nr:hypothetical protein FACS189485_05280 [Spirochaetia bacterium]
MMSGKIFPWGEYICSAREKYITELFSIFDKNSGIGMSYHNLCSVVIDLYSYGPQGPYLFHVLESKKEFVDIIDYASLRDASVYAVFVNKNTNEITRKLPSTKFWAIYDSLLESGYFEVHRWGKNWKELNFFGLNK